MPERQNAIVCFNFEIQMAQHFEYDDIHVKYEIHIPDECQTIDGRTQLIGCTHASQRNLIDGCWLIGYCHELTLSCKLDGLFKGTHIYGLLPAAAGFFVFIFNRLFFIIFRNVKNNLRSHIN